MISEKVMTFKKARNMTFTGIQVQEPLSLSKYIGFLQIHWFLTCLHLSPL